MKYARAASWIFLGWLMAKLRLPKRWVHEVEDQATMRMYACSLDFEHVPWSGDFYEDDEPVEKIAAAFERGEKVVTKAPHGWTCEHLTVTASGLNLTSAPTFSCGCVLQPLVA